MERSAPERHSFEHFDRYLRRRDWNERLTTVIVAAVIAIAAITLVSRALGDAGVRVPAVPPAQGGLILFGERNPNGGRAHWFTMRPDGSDLTDLHVTATCATWLPDGSKILITNDAAVGPGSPLRPAVINPDGSGLQPLDGTRNPNLNLGCGDVSPDGARITLEGFGGAGHHDLNGIYSIRASDGGGLVRLIKGPVEPPSISPDGSRISFKRVQGSLNPSASGALFVTNSDGSGPVRITPPGYVSDVPAWSPDGRWIVFQRPYGQLFIVHPSGTDLQQVPLTLPPGSWAQHPTWSPDGSMIVFSVLAGDRSGVYVVRMDGTGLHEVRAISNPQTPDWGRAAG
jgi:Tol biopolymer transport system component